MRIHSVAILFALVAQAVPVQPMAAQSMPTYWRLADPEAKVLVGVDVKALLSSQAAGEWKGQLAKAAGDTIPLDMIRALNDGGVLGQLLQHVDRVFLSFAEVPQNTSKARGTVALVGDFDLAALRKFMVKQGGAKSVYRGVEVWQSGKSADNVMIALASPQVLALGDKASVRKAVSQFAVGNGTLMDRPVFQHAAALAQNNDIWIAGEVPATAAGGSDMTAQLLKSVQSFDLGVRMKSGVALDVNLYAESAESATGLAAALQAMAQLAANGSGNPQAADLLSHLEMGTEGERIQMSASWTPTELAAAARQAGGTLAKGRKPGGAPAPVLTANRTGGQPLSPAANLVPEPPKPRAPLKVRIYNPDGGVREFELTKD